MAAKSKKKTPQTRDYVDIRDHLDGPIRKVIAALQELAAAHPEGEIDVRVGYQYGEPVLEAQLEYWRDQTPLEQELFEWRDKASKLHALQAEERAFKANGISHPRGDEIVRLRRELGFFAKPHGWLHIFNGEILIEDHSRGSRRRDGTFVLKRLPYSDLELDKMFEAQDAPYRFDGPVTAAPSTPSPPLPE